MAYLRGSENYVWSTHDILGHGTTGVVYKARHKKTGELYAVKIFNDLSQMRPVSVQMRELEVLRKLRHKNIAQLLAIEEETRFRGKVVVMELCTGGSLYNLLDQPENAYGLEEAEFFVVLHDVACGIKYLWDHDIVHRDIKPGNIMRYLKEDTSSIYKLIDFGAARQLDPDEQFMSLYGTEEYLHPAMYERAVLRRPTDKQFDASVDLWSLGVTMYHTASGQLPFLPYGGTRSNKEVMHEMTTQKMSGVISGVQHKLNGDIEWSRSLPHTCQLSHGARMLVTPLLAGLLESDEMKVWSFERFFVEVTAIHERCLVHVFDVSALTLHQVYTSGDETDAKLRELLAGHLGMEPSKQVLVYDGCLLTDIVQPLQQVRTYPATTPDKPIFLICTSAAKSTHFTQPVIPAFAMSGSEPTLQSDAQSSKANARIVFYLLRLCHRSHSYQRLVHKAVKIIRRMLVSDTERLHDYIRQFCVLVVETRKRCETLQSMQSNRVQLAAQIDIINKVEETSIACREQMELLHAEVISRCGFGSKWNADFGCQPLHRCTDSLHSYAKSMHEIAQNFHHDAKVNRALLHNDLQIHKFDAQKLRTARTKALNFLQGQCLETQEQISECFVSWNKEASDMKQHIRNIESKISCASTLLTDVSSNLDLVSHTNYSTGKPDIVNRSPSSMSHDRLVSCTARSSQISNTQLTQILLQLEADISEIKTVIVQNNLSIQSLNGNIRNISSW